MERVNGQPLDQAWAECTQPQRENILSQLQNYFQELRRVEGTFTDTESVLENCYCAGKFPSARLQPLTHTPTVQQLETRPTGTRA